MMRLAVCVTLITLSMAVAPSTSGGATPSPATFFGRANIVLILTDDQTADELGYMPIVASELIGKGESFTRAFVPTSFCCPSRTSILTGRYAHSTDVYRNEPPHGGFGTFLGKDGSTIATWLHDAGYTTGLVGKYLNGYESTYVPPGWSRWVGEFVGDQGDTNKGYYDYDMNIDGKVAHFAFEPEDYSVDVLANYSTDFIRSAPAGKPLFLYFAPHAPHAPATPPPRYSNKLKDLPKYRPPNFNEADISDKPPWMQRLHLLDQTEIQIFDEFRNRQFRTLMAVDDAVGSILGALRDTNRLENTLIVFTSDNGLAGGSHRWHTKKVAWEESIHVPMILRYDPETMGMPQSDGHLVLNIDLAPTFADAAPLTAPDTEGTSLLPLLLPGPHPEWRQDFLLEQLGYPIDGPTYVPTYCGVRTVRYKYVRYEEQINDGIRVSEEMYDLAADPYELNNLAGDMGYALLKATLHQRMVKLCAPPPPGYIP